MSQPKSERERSRNRSDAVLASCWAEDLTERGAQLLSSCAKREADGEVDQHWRPVSHPHTEKDVGLAPPNA